MEELIMALLFKSKAERERDERRKHRKAFRDAETAMDAVKDRIKDVKKERDSSWQEARRYLKDGNKSAAQRALQSVRSAEMMIHQLDKKRWVFEQLVTKLEISKTDQDFSKALSEINKVIKADPETVQSILDEVNETFGEQVMVDKTWNHLYEKELEGVETAENEDLPSLDELLKNLEDEVVADVSRGKIPDDEVKENSSIKEGISEGRIKLKHLLEDEK
jgi:hypothetical protein